MVMHVKVMARSAVRRLPASQPSPWDSLRSQALLWGGLCAHSTITKLTWISLLVRSVILLFSFMYVICFNGVFTSGKTWISLHQIKCIHFDVHIR